MQSFEKLGLFYLGKKVDPKSRALTDDYLLYDSADLVTHAVCVGMTGSGKTGLCIGLLEEAAIDNIPAIVIDPKGDLGNLLLTFPDLKAENFLPWIQEEEARRCGLAAQDYAQQQADAWKSGLAQWGEDGERIRRLQSSAEFAIYTPGSSAGLPVSIVKSFAAPPPQTDADSLAEKVQTTTSGLLGLLGIQSDPLRSREHILVSNLLDHAWRSGTDLDLPMLIQRIQTPPLQRVGVFDLESFYPASDRFQLAMTLNNLLAAPGFGSWLEGEPLDVGRLLHSEQGKPRVSIFSIAHLSDAERMFFVTLLLNHVVGWMRTQSGTTSLRAVLYMDEVFGFFPPVAEPPSKRPLLTLLKQARAYGLGVVLATQNPVDLDYKGLSNAGTWLIGRLQTEQDKERLMDGLASVASSSGTAVDRATLSDQISSLGKRVFLLQNVHERQPVVFQTRWALCYLAGPLTKSQIKLLMDPRKQAKPIPAAPQQPSAAASSASPAATPAAQALSAPPQLPPEIRQFFAPVSSPPADLVKVAGAPGQLTYHPYLYAAAKLHILSNKYGVSQAQSVAHALELTGDSIAALWDQAREFPLPPDQLGRQPVAQAAYLPLPPTVLQSSRLSAWQKGYADYLARQYQLTLWRSQLFKLTSQPGESERDFRIRLQQLARERRDLEVGQMRQRYAGKTGSLQRQLLIAEQRIQREQEQYGQQKVQTAISFGATLLGAVLGRKTASIGTLGRATTAARGASRIAREKQDVQRAVEQKGALEAQLKDLEQQLQQEADQLAKTYDPQTEMLQEIPIRPSKSDILVQEFGILWVPLFS